MKKFILTVLGYILIICLFVVCINEGYKLLDRTGKTKFENIPEGLQICNLGSSHGLFGYNYETICDEYTCFNFSLESQSLSYDYRILVNYQDRLQENAIVFITVSYFSFFGRDEIDEDNFESKNQRYYKFLPAELIKQYDWTTSFYVAKFPALADCETLVRVFRGQNWNVKDWSEYSSWQQTVDPEKAAESAKSAYYRHIVGGKTDVDGERVYNQEEIEALYDIIALCRERDAIPVRERSSSSSA